MNVKTNPVKTKLINVRIDQELYGDLKELNLNVSDEIRDHLRKIVKTRKDEEIVKTNPLVKTEDVHTPEEKKDWRTTPKEVLDSEELKKVWETNVTGQGGAPCPGKEDERED